MWCLCLGDTNNFIWGSIYVDDPDSKHSSFISLLHHYLSGFVPGCQLIPVTGLELCGEEKRLQELSDCQSVSAPHCNPLLPQIRIRQRRLGQQEEEKRREEKPVARRHGQRTVFEEGKLVEKKIFREGSWRIIIKATKKAQLKELRDTAPWCTL